MIPKYEEIMLPFLEYLSDGNEHSLSEISSCWTRRFKEEYLRH